MILIDTMEINKSEIFTWSITNATHSQCTSLEWKKNITDGIELYGARMLWTKTQQLRHKPSKWIPACDPVFKIAVAASCKFLQQSGFRTKKCTMWKQRHFSSIRLHIIYNTLILVQVQHIYIKLIRHLNRYYTDTSRAYKFNIFYVPRGLQFFTRWWVTKLVKVIEFFFDWWMVGYGSFVFFISQGHKVVSNKESAVEESYADEAGLASWWVSCRRGMCSYEHELRVFKRVCQVS